ncbi:hypothetical protein ACTHQ4_16700 [Alkalicoccobacillus gibsonii]|uniref:hypothetical protein n=1 Tax=Alkalicoccobacillus gibsonii TaxID=79881 RepID=UPI003F7CC0E8
MNIIISQPKQEDDLQSLEYHITSASQNDLVFFPEGYIKRYEDVRNVAKLAHSKGIFVVTGYLDKDSKDRALIIDNKGRILLDRRKTRTNEQLVEPFHISLGEMKIGYILCMEILKGYEQLDQYIDLKLDIIFHPIGTGMFSEAQFTEWIREATRISEKYDTTVIGTSHADGSFQNCGISIPISYVVKKGETIFISKNDTRSRMYNISTERTYIFNTKNER